MNGIEEKNYGLERRTEWHQKLHEVAKFTSGLLSPLCHVSQDSLFEWLDGRSHIVFTTEICVLVTIK